MKDKVFYRNPLLKDWLKALIISGCEIGLHTDAFNLYLNFNVDGAMAIVEELNWLRLQNANIVGTAAHNSFPTYNAENFEIFKNYALWGRSEGGIDGKYFPIGVLDEEKLNLTYEANFPIIQKRLKNKTIQEKIEAWCKSTNSESVEAEKWMYTYLLDNPCFERGFDANVWHHGGNKWSIAIKRKTSITPRWYWRVDSKLLFRFIENLPNNLSMVFHLHPIYFSRDS
jgi:hypothetical protein